MGKNLIQQRRGKGSGRFRKPTFRFKGDIKMLHKESYIVKDLVRCAGHSAPLIEAKYDDGSTSLLIAAEGISVGDTFKINNGEVKIGNIMSLKNIPEGTSVFCIEGRPGDGGKFVRGSGTSAKVVAKNKDAITILLPSKKQKIFHPECRAMIGVASGAGRPDKPLLKAGKKHHIAKSKNQYYPIVSGSAMNAVAHPFGNKRSLRKSKAKPTSRNAPPGRKVGMIAARRTGRRK
ncbi:50S ribosomal protein L2 [Candidatus Woesearchaeota archaeon]|nr:50S ribosomal protein L2 [Candidatus Woesearchaeota archaeon]MCF7901665.1 50S ribosomal protein L2 [Candidatus Woesearchaeota archaeon]MCF8013339.1 50S ribosomal protein L2 [Candidatus Woesearchaeota archaeon]